MYYKNCFSLYKDLLLDDDRIPEATKNRIRLINVTDEHPVDDTKLLKKELEQLAPNLKMEYERKWQIVEKHLQLS
jgi:hypothetical protein